MLEPNSSRLGNFDFRTRPLDEKEKKFYGIFISHSSKNNDEYLNPLRTAMLQAQLYPLCDRDFLRGGVDYKSEIENALDCYAAVIIVTKESLLSHWVHYEIGFLSGMNIPIYVWDPKRVLSPKNEKRQSALSAFGRAQLNPYLPAFTDMKELVRELSALSPYSDMFCEENSFLDRRGFRQRMNQHVETIIATLESDLFDTYYDNFTDCKIGTLIPNFGMFYPDHGDGLHCYANAVAMPLPRGTCPQNGLPCALSLPRTLGEENKECVLLNHTLYNGRIYRTGDLDRRGKRIERGCIVFHLPVHRLYGTEFKFVIDVPDHRRFDTLIHLLEEMQVNPSSSDLGQGERIYLSLPERRQEGLFQLHHQFSNNFLCPHATRVQKEETFRSR